MREVMSLSRGVYASLVDKIGSFDCVGPCVREEEGLIEVKEECFSSNGDGSRRV